MALGRQVVNLVGASILHDQGKGIGITEVACEASVQGRRVSRFLTGREPWIPSVADRSAVLGLRPWDETSALRRGAAGCKSLLSASRLFSTHALL